MISFKQITIFGYFLGAWAAPASIGHRGERSSSTRRLTLRNPANERRCVSFEYFIDGLKNTDGHYCVEADVYDRELTFTGVDRNSGWFVYNPRRTVKGDFGYGCILEYDAFDFVERPNSFYNKKNGVMSPHVCPGKMVKFEPYDYIQGMVIEI